MKSRFAMFHRPAGTHVGVSVLYLDLEGVEAIYPVISATETKLAEIKMRTGTEWTVIGSADAIAQQIEEHYQ